jgi:hypothetical protein
VTAAQEAADALVAAVRDGAHNASIVAGYLAHRGLARRELPLERFFMDVALVRVLFAHALLTAPRLALGPLGPAGRLVGDPRWRGACRACARCMPTPRPSSASRGCWTCCATDGPPTPGPMTSGTRGRRPGRRWPGGSRAA